jgi:hypothetical protein
MRYEEACRAARTLAESEEKPVYVVWTMRGTYAIQISRPDMCECVIYPHSMVRVPI